MDKENQTISLGKDVWNIAEGFTKLKVLKPMVLLDKLEMISIYGADELDLPEELPPHIIIQRRIEGLNRFKDMLKLLLGNVQFVIKEKDDKKILEDLKKKIEDVEGVMDSIKIESLDFATEEKEVKINDVWFNACLIVLQDIKNKLNEPINNANLIFKKGSELSFEDLEREIILGG